MIRLQSKSGEISIKLWHINNQNSSIWSKPATKTDFQFCTRPTHSEIRCTRKLISKRFVWPSINRDVSKWTKSYHVCLSSKVIRHSKTSLGSFEISTPRVANIHMDIVGPLPHSEVFRYILTIIDRFTRWPGAVSLKYTTSSTKCNQSFSEQRFHRTLKSALTCHGEI